uniref:Uncharacterized protein MANES_13G131300 n=1 Tax=Rhizophora mucronata TaxID=61149 RepID=A0A2P2QPZ9_RHIMU
MLICLAILARVASSRKYLGNKGVSSSTPMLKLNTTDVANLTRFRLVSNADARLAV